MESLCCLPCKNKSSRQYWTAVDKFISILITLHDLYRVSCLCAAPAVLAVFTFVSFAAQQQQWLQFAKSETHLTTAEWVREKERETECRFVYPERDNTFKRADIARFALPSGKWTKVCSSCGQLRAAAAFAASAKYIENLPACLPALPGCHPHSSLLEALKTAFCICLSVCELRTKFATH